MLSVKIAGANGAADVSNVLAAIQWVVSFKDDYGIRVLNLSLGTDSTQTYREDPFNYAVQRAWNAGIAVVVSAGNLGPGAGTISKPGDDPWVITVGSHIISLRAPGSTVDATYPTYVDGSYRRGSGTSMATGVVAGAAALLLQRNPSATPNRVKYALKATARDAASDDPLAVGAGQVDAYRAAFSAPPGEANQGLDRSSGFGSLGGSRGSVQTQADDPGATVLGSTLGATLTVQLLLWNPGAYVNAGWRPADWYVSTWAVFRFWRLGWYTSDWPGSKWHGATWYGEPRDETYGETLPGSAWYGVWE